MNPFYAILANGMTAALASPTGAIDWFPAPRFDSPSIFSRILDAHAGGYLSLEPEQWDAVTQSYHHEGLFLDTHFKTPYGDVTTTVWLEIGRSCVWITSNTPFPLILTCRPSFDYGVVRPAFTVQPNGLRYQNPIGNGMAQLVIQGPFKQLGRMDQWLCGPGPITVAFRVATESKSDLRWLTSPISGTKKMLEKSKHFWETTNALPASSPYFTMFHRSLQVIRGLTYRPTGVPVAAATTSLPEIPGESRQWDYRYVWVRDSAYAAESLLVAGDKVGARRIAEFLLNAVLVTGRVFPAPFFRVDGTLPEKEQDLLWLSGYEQSRPVRTGNTAVTQRQLDLVGSVLWLVYRLWQETKDDSWVEHFWWAISTMAEWAHKTWSQDDASLWEYRTIRGQHTHSRMMNWLGLKSAVILANDIMKEGVQAARWNQTAERISTTLKREAESGGSFLTRSTGGSPDAALLTLPLYGFVPVHDPSFVRTLEIIKRDLLDDGLVYRYRTDDFGASRYPFLLAGFWYARILLRQGRLDEADYVIRRHMDQATPLGLFGEHTDQKTGSVRGNFPQLFSHGALVMTLIEREWALQGVPWPEVAFVDRASGTPSTRRRQGAHNV